MLNKMITITSLFVLFFSSVSGYARVKWNEYYEEPIYRNYENKRILMKDLPVLPSRAMSRIDCEHIGSLSSWIPMKSSSSVVLDSLIRVDRMLVGEPSVPLDYKLYKDCITIDKSVESYLVYSLGIDKKSLLYLVNVQNGYLKSVMLVSYFDRHNMAKSWVILHRNGHGLDLFGNRYYSIVSGNIGFDEDLGKRTARIGLNKDGLLSVERTYTLLYPSNRYYVDSSFYDENYLSGTNTIKKADGILTMNFRNGGIVLSSFPHIKLFGGRRIDIKRIQTMPTTPLSALDAKTIGPALFENKWGCYSIYWLNEVHCQKRVKSILVLAISANMTENPGVFLVNFKNSRLTSFARVSSLGIESDYLVHSYSTLGVGKLRMHTKYEDEVIISMGDVILGPHFIGYTPKERQNVMLLDKDGYLTRR